jgi:hypothetical protein
LDPKARRSNGYLGPKEPVFFLKWDGGCAARSKKRVFCWMELDGVGWKLYFLCLHFFVLTFFLCLHFYQFTELQIALHVSKNA